MNYLYNKNIFEYPQIVVTNENPRIHDIEGHSIDLPHDHTSRIGCLWIHDKGIVSHRCQHNLSKLRLFVFHPSWKASNTEKEKSEFFVKSIYKSMQYF